MTIKPFTIVLIVVLVVLVMMLFMGGSPSEGFGQDATSRVQAGWVAGPMYGVDPIKHFAEQIANMKYKLREGEYITPSGHITY